MSLGQSIMLLILFLHLSQTFVLGIKLEIGKVLNIDIFTLKNYFQSLSTSLLQFILISFQSLVNVILFMLTNNTFATFFLQQQQVEHTHFSFYRKKSICSAYRIVVATIVFFENVYLIEVFLSVCTFTFFCSI